MRSLHTAEVQRLSLVNKIFILCKTKKYKFVLAEVLLVNCNELNFNLPKFAHSLYMFFPQAFWHFYFFFTLKFATFSPQNVTCLEVGQDGKSRLQSMSISANQTREFCSSQSL